ncbi:50S ribosomal protein L23 [Candidatus Gottesmanbacteria bacterium]|nr:50S ribosomal protein L23 [Candidatus Gottesmanbacteria bacterium]
MTISYIIKGPIITEKSLLDSKNNIYTFKVEKNATKSQIKKAIEDTFNVHVKGINTVRIKGKKRLAGRKRKLSYESDYKKARVMLAATEKISLFEVGGEK